MPYGGCNGMGVPGHQGVTNEGKPGVARSEPRTELTFLQNVRVEIRGGLD